MHKFSSFYHIELFTFFLLILADKYLLASLLASLLACLLAWHVLEILILFLQCLQCDDDCGPENDAIKRYTPS